MGAKKDIKRVKELIFGNDIVRFEEKFELLEEKLNTLENRQESFKKSVKEYFKQLNKEIDGLKDNQNHFAKGLKQQGCKMDIYMEDIVSEMKSVAKKNAEQLKALKTELKMHIEVKLNGLDKAKISHTQLSEMFASLSNELKDIDDKQRHTR